MKGFKKQNSKSKFTPQPVMVRCVECQLLSGKGATMTGRQKEYWKAILAKNTEEFHDLEQSPKGELQTDNLKEGSYDGKSADISSEQRKGTR